MTATAALRVAVDLTSVSPGGGSVYVLSQLPLFARDGIEVMAFVPPAMQKPVLAAVDRCEAIVVPGNKVMRQAYLHLRMPRVAARRGADVLYCPGSTAPLWGRVPCVLLVQNPHLFAHDAPRSLRLSLLRVVCWLAAVRSNATVHISQSAADEFAATAGLRGGGHVIWSGPGRDFRADERRSSAAPLPAWSPYVLTVSNHYRYKRTDLVVAAFAHSDLAVSHHLVVAGGFPEPGVQGELAAQAADLGIGPRVHFLGFVDGDALRQLYEQADLYVSLSEREAFPLTPAEAMMVGTPVVLSGIAPFRELYGDVARIVDDSSVAAAAEAMTASIATVTDVGPLIAQRFSWERNVARLEAIFRQVRGTPRPKWRSAGRRFQRRAVLPLLRTVAGDPKARA